MEWQPIETAPKDRFHVLLFGDGPGFKQCSFVGYWYEHDGVWFSFDHKPAGQPTHWMPLPKAPNAPAQGPGGSSPGPAGAMG